MKIELLEGLGLKVLRVESVLIPVGKLSIPAVGLVLSTVFGEIAGEPAALVLAGGKNLLELGGSEGGGGSALLGFGRGGRGQRGAAHRGGQHDGEENQ